MATTASMKRTDRLDRHFDGIEMEKWLPTTDYDEDSEDDVNKEQIEKIALEVEQETSLKSHCFTCYKTDDHDGLVRQSDAAAVSCPTCQKTAIDSLAVAKLYQDEIDALQAKVAEQSAEIERLTQERDEWKERAESSPLSEEAVDILRSQLAGKDTDIVVKQGAIDMLNSMNDQLQAEVGRLTAELKESDIEIDALTQTVGMYSERIAALEKDAARYRWLRDRPWQACHTLFPSAPWMHEGYEANQERMDATIDAARKEVHG